MSFCNRFCHYNHCKYHFDFEIPNWNSVAVKMGTLIKTKGNKAFDCGYCSINKRMSPNLTKSFLFCDCLSVQHCVSKNTQYFLINRKIAHKEKKKPLPPLQR